MKGSRFVANLPVTSNGFPYALVAAVLLAIPVPSSGEEPSRGADSTRLVENTTWIVTELPSVLRSRIHIRAADVPPFPIDHEKLKHPELWPPTLVVAGEICSLRVSAGTDAIRTERSLKGVRPNDEWYSLYYVGPPYRGWPYWGPKYHWTPGGWNSERSWHTPDSTKNVYVVKTYRRSGELFRCEWRNESLLPFGDTRAVYEYFEEIFTPNGGLLGCSYSRTQAGNAHRVTFWAGHEVTPTDYSEKKHDQEVLVRTRK